MSEQERNDSFRAGRRAPTSSARKEKQALHPPADRGRGRVGATRLATVDATGGSTSQTAPSQIMDTVPARAALSRAGVSGAALSRAA